MKLIGMCFTDKSKNIKLTENELIEETKRKTLQVIYIYKDRHYMKKSLRQIYL